MSEKKLDENTTGDISANAENHQPSPRERLEGTELTPYADENANIGTALRRVYQQTVDESVPTEMLDLLKRLS